MKRFFSNTMKNMTYYFNHVEPKFSPQERPRSLFFGPTKTIGQTLRGDITYCTEQLIVRPRDYREVQMVGPQVSDGVFSKDTNFTITEIVGFCNALNNEDCSVETLDLEAIELSSMNSIDLAQNLHHNKSLKTLKGPCCHDIKNSGIQAFLLMIPNTNLETLTFRNYNVINYNNTFLIHDPKTYEAIRTVATQTSNLSFKKIIFPNNLEVYRDEIEKINKINPNIMNMGSWVIFNDGFASYDEKSKNSTKFNT